MLRLPKKIGPFTLMRKLGSDGVTESYAGILDEPAGKQVVVRKIMPYLLIEGGQRTTTEARVHDLKAIRHPTLVPVLDLVADSDDRYMIEAWVDAVDLRTVLDHCIEQHAEIPHNVYLNLATQICNGLEALHGRPGSASGAENVLHLSLKPESIFVTASGKLLVGNYGLTATPTGLPKSGASGAQMGRMEYLSPEQTQPDQALTPASDIFSLGSILYELLTQEALFKAESNLQTIHRVRRAEVTAQLLKVKEVMPGLDKVLYRALSLNPRHRYQRAFVLREDLRGLMAGYSFSNISDETSSFLAPLFAAQSGRRGTAGRQEEPGYDDTASILRHSLQQSGKDPSSLNQAPEDTGGWDQPGETPEDTQGYVKAARGGLDRHNPTLEPQDSLDEPSVTEPSPIDAPRRQESTQWVHSGPPGSADAPPPEGDKAHTTWFQTGKDEGSGPDAFDDERPTDVEPEPRPPRSTGSTPVESLAASVPPPPQRRPEQPVSHTETTYDDEWPPKRGGSNGLLIGVGAAVVVALGVLVCGVVGGGGILFGTQTRGGGTEIADVEPVTRPAPAPTEPAVADVEPDVEPAPAPVASAPRTVPDPAPARPRPAPVAPTGRPAPVAVSRPAPAPAPRPAPVTSPRPAPVPVATSPRPAPITQPDPVPIQRAELVPDEPFELGELGQYSDQAYRGALSASERGALQEYDAAHPDYTRAMVLLYQDAKARDDTSDREQYLSGIMGVAENQYDPRYLTEQAEIAIRHEDYDTALERANLAERHWARLPSDLIFSRKAMIYEIQASAHQGKFYESGGEDLESLYQAIRSWEKYQRHVQTKSREDLTVRAEDQLAKLYDMKRRLEQP